MLVDTPRVRRQAFRAAKNRVTWQGKSCGILEDKMNNEETAIERATNLYEYRITITWTNVLMTAVVRTQMQSNPAYGDNEMQLV